MREYHKVLNKLASNKQDYRMPCMSEGNIQSWLAVAFNHADHDMRIYSDKLNVRILKSTLVLEAMVGFLSHLGTRLRILLKSHPDQEVLDILSSLPGTIEIRVADGNYADKETAEFAVMDCRGYRYEAKGIHFLNFNHPSEASILVNAFDRAFQLGYDVLDVLDVLDVYESSAAPTDNRPSYGEPG